MTRPNLDRYIAGWRGPVLAALLTLLIGLPSLLLLPPLDRDESRYAQATSQMLESGDYVDIRFQDEPRWKKPVGIYWMQAASVALTSDVENRDIAPYRLPSLLCRALAALALAWADSDGTRIPEEGRGGGVVLVGGVCTGGEGGGGLRDLLGGGGESGGLSEQGERVGAACRSTEWSGCGAGMAWG